jgi:DNA (cytosine-5)-methyltransferase 1
MGFDAQWGVLGGNHIGAPHRRERIWILANTKKTGQQARIKQAPKTGRFSLGVQPWGGIRGRNKLQEDAKQFCVGNDGLAYNAHQIAALGNGQIPSVAATAWRMLGGT